MLQKQMGQVKERMLKSENERRRLTLEMDDLRVKLRSLEDVRDQHSHQSNRSEAAHNENLKSLQLRLDNAQFQAHKAEKKLEEFRERVRNDILKIRLKERELSNKLELQKRDAEALLSAKDERLLAQKREIDRLEFEIDNLKERMIDDTRRAEERAAKLTRALKSLRMAQGMLSGIQEEVLPGTGGNDSDGEAA
jgi:chromosome segregation ATPase